MSVAWPTAETPRDFGFTVLLSLLFTAVVFLPQVGFKGPGGGENFQGDALNFWLPQYSVLEYYVRHGVLTGIDFTTQNGAAEWFMRPNLISYHPLYLAMTFFTDKISPVQQAVALVIMLWMHAFLSVFCLYRVGRAFLGFDRAIASFAAVTYSLSFYLPTIMSQVPYAYVVWLLPPIVYGALACAHKLTPSRVLFASAPVFSIMLAGYMPMALYSAGLAAIFLLLYVFVFSTDGASYVRRGFVAAKGFAPFIVAAGFSFFFLFAVNSYLKGVFEPTYKDNIRYSAYDLAEPPHAFFRLFSGMFTIPGPFVEFDVYWGCIVFAIVTIFVVRSASLLPKMSTSYRGVMAASWCLYIFHALLIYGSATAVSALFYYFMPVVGMMHIYQRFLPIAHLFFVLAIAVMLSAVANSERRGVEKLLLLAFFLLGVVATWVISTGAKIAPFGFSEHLITEILYGCAFLFALIALGRRTAIWAATLFMFLIPLERVYIFVNTPELNILGAAAKYQPLDEAAAQSLDHDLISYKGTKAVMKYADITPGIWGAVPENYPWFRINQTYMSSYSGYDFHVGVKRDYRLRNPTTVPAGVTDWRVLPDPAWIKATGADAILFQPGDPANNPELMAMVDLSDASKVHTVRGVYTLAPLKTDSPPQGSAADNGFFRVAAPGAASILKFKTNHASKFDLVVKTEKPGRLEYLFWPNERLLFWVNGKRVTPGREPSGLLSLPVPAGQSVIKVRYHNLPIQLFLIGYLVYALLFVAAIVAPLVQAARRSGPKDQLGAAGIAASIRRRAHLLLGQIGSVQTAK